MHRKLLLSFAVASLVFGAAYKIPEQSLRSIGLSAAYVASAMEADASYFNPANMSFIKQKKFEADLTYIYLTKISFEGNVANFPANAKSKDEKFLVPHFHYVHPVNEKVAFGLSFAVPAGLSKRWDSPQQKASAKEFTLKVMEISPSLSYKISENFSVAAGIRAIYSEGEVNLESTALKYKVDMDGDTGVKLGYNLALTYSNNQYYTFAATYRSKITLKEKGSANGFFTSPLLGRYNFDCNANVSVPLPAALNLAIATKIAPATLMEFVYERTYWGSYKQLDFDYADNFVETTKIPFINRSLGAPKTKNWQDTNTFRVGLSHQYNTKLTTLFGISYDETPIKDKYVGFELPDNDALIVSCGIVYKSCENSLFGISYLYDYKFSRKISQQDANENGIVGKFKDSRAHLLTLSYNHRF